MLLSFAFSMHEDQELCQPGCTLCATPVWALRGSGEFAGASGRPPRGRPDAPANSPDPYPGGSRAAAERKSRPWPGQAGSWMGLAAGAWTLRFAGRADCDAASAAMWNLSAMCCVYREMLLQHNSRQWPWLP